MALSETETLEKLQRGYAAFNSGDFDAAVALVHRDFELVPTGDLPPLRGAEALRAWMEPDAFDEQQIEPLEFTVAGDKVLVRQVVRARGSGSRIEMEQNMWAVWTVDADGIWLRVEAFPEHEEAAARHAAGLES